MYERAFVVLKATLLLNKNPDDAHDHEQLMFLGKHLGVLFLGIKIIAYKSICTHNIAQPHIGITEVIVLISKSYLFPRKIGVHTLFLHL